MARRKKRLGEMDYQRGYTPDEMSSRVGEGWFTLEGTAAPARGQGRSIVRDGAGMMPATLPSQASAVAGSALARQVGTPAVTSNSGGGVTQGAAPPVTQTQSTLSKPLPKAGVSKISTTTLRRS